MSILLVEDNQKLANNVAQYLQTEKYAVTLAHDGEAGLYKALTENYDLIILDLNLPKKDGLAICADLRQKAVNTPILMLTARTGTAHTVAGLNTGADDYLTKPFELDELLARVRALLRRQTVSRSPLLEVGDLRVDTNTQQVSKKGKPCVLAPKEYALLEFLLKNRGMAQDRTSIIEHVWGEEANLLFSQTVDVHVAYLRKKLGKRLIRTIHGKGYAILD